MFEKKDPLKLSEELGAKLGKEIERELGEGAKPETKETAASSPPELEPKDSGVDLGVGASADKADEQATGKQVVSPEEAEKILGEKIDAARQEENYLYAKNHEKIYLARLEEEKDRIEELVKKTEEKHKSLKLSERNASGEVTDNLLSDFQEVNRLQKQVGQQIDEILSVPDSSVSPKKTETVIENINEVASMAEEEKKATERVEGVAPEKPEKEKEKTSEDFLKDLEEPRLDYLKGEKKLKEVEQKVKNLENIRGGSEIGQQRKAEIENEYEQFKKEFEPIKGNYDKVLNDYQKSLYLKKEAELAKDAEKDKKLKEYTKTELYEETLIKESQRVNEAKQENLSPAQKKWYHDCLYKFSQLPKWERWAITGGVATGVAFSMGTISSAAIAGYFGTRIVRSAVGGLAGALTDQVLGRRIAEGKIKTEKEIKSEIGEKIETAKGFEEIMKIYSEQSPEVFKKLEVQRAKEHNQHVKKTIATLLVAGGTSAGLGFLENYLTAHGYLEGLGVKPKGPGLVPEKKLGVLQPGEKPAGGGQPGEMLGGVEQPAATPFHELTVHKGESPLLLAKRIYMENAAKLGYKSEMGVDLKKWAEIASTRHIVGQYITEHTEEYGDLIEKMGAPSADPAEFDKWLQQVPKNVFNEILHEKVPNLVYEGDVVRVDAEGDIAAFGPDGDARLEHIEVTPGATLTEIKVEAPAEAGIKPPELLTLKETPPGTPEFYEIQQRMEGIKITPEEQLANIKGSLESAQEQIDKIQTELTNPNLTLEEYNARVAQLADIKKFSELADKKLDLLERGEAEPLTVKELLPPKVMEVANLNLILEKGNFADWLPKQKELVDNLFYKYLGHSFENFKGLPVQLKESYMVKLNEAMGKVVETESGASVELPYKVFLWRNVGEMKWVRQIWDKFGAK